MCVRSLDGIVTSKADAIFIDAGLGGGTGSGGAPVFVHHLQRLYDGPVYALGVLPGRNEGTLYQANAGRSLKTLLRRSIRCCSSSQASRIPESEPVTRGRNRQHAGPGRRRSAGQRPTRRAGVTQRSGRSDQIQRFVDRARDAKRAQERESTDHAEQFADDRLENLL